MLVRDHTQTAQEFLAASDREFAVGDTLQASEKLWGAAAHAIMAVAQQRDLEHGTHRALINAARSIADEMDDERLRTGILAAQHFHSNFYRGHFATPVPRPARRTSVNHPADFVIDCPPEIPGISGFLQFAGF